LHRRTMLIAAAVVLVINLIALPFLPERVGIQYGFGGFTNYAPKWVFVILTPAILLVVAASTRRDTSSRIIFVAVLVLIVDLVMIGVNLALQ